ncbi:MAG: tail fiber domain-containing protein [Cyclobacteriaceae bacterium]
MKQFVYLLSKELGRTSKHLAAAVLLFIGSVAMAQTISIQGVLRDPNGSSMNDGSYSVTFKIYDVSTGGTALWSDTYTSLKTKHGVFQANLGENTSLDGLAFDKTYYVGVTVENFAEMTPRIALTVYPYAKAILGQDNKFPSTGNIVLAKDSLVIKQGGVKLEGPDGRIVFNDGTSLNTANFSGPASGLLNPSSININADNDGDNTGNINFQINGVNQAAIDNNGNLSVGAISAKHLEINDTSIVAQNDASNSTLHLNPSGEAVHAGRNIIVGKDDEVRGWIDLYGAGTGEDAGGRVNFFKAADHDGDGSATTTEYWFMEAINDDLRIGNIWDNNDVMTINNEGNVGIGRIPSTTRLEIQTDGTDQKSIFVEHGSSNLIVRPTSAGGTGTIIENTGGGGLVLQPTSGNVGIGTSTPTQARLVIANSPSVSTNVAYSWSGSSGNSGAIIDWPNANGGNSGYFAPFSVWADGNYGGLGFVTASDKRIKEVIARSDNDSDLDLLNQITITDYAFIDKVQHGDKVEKKVIAQEVAAIFPQAVTKSTNVIPNIYEVPKRVTYSNGSLKISLHDTHQLNTGDKVQLFIDDQKVLLEVDGVLGDRSFTVAFDKNPDSIFVYGQEVDDFHTVDYDAISMLNVSATQELAKRTADQEARISELEVENAKLRKQLERLNSLEAKVNILLGEDKADATLVGKN